MTQKDADAISGFFPGEEGRKGEAESFARFVQGKRLEGIKGDRSLLDKLWGKLRYYLRIIANGLRGKGWTSAEQIFGKIYSGTYTPSFGRTRRGRGQTALTLGGVGAEGMPGGLSNAVELETQGVPVPAIWEKTGWLKGIEDKWRFEIDDRDAKLAPIPKWEKRATVEPGDFLIKEQWEHVTLKEVLDHPELYKYYPQLKEIRIEVDKNAGGKGEFTEATNTITIHPERLVSRERVKITLFHEIQHAIQAIEGFSRGGSPQEFAGKFSDVQHNFGYYSNVLKIRELLDSGKFKSRKEVADEFNKQKKEELEALGLRAPSPITGTTFADMYATAEQREAEDLRKRLNDLYAVGKEIINASKSKLKELAGESYWKLAAEIEARDTSVRLHYDAETRKRIMPYSSTDIPRSEWIVKDGAGAVTSFEVEPAYLEMANKAKKFFGVTENPNEAGFIMPDGSMLDFSGEEKDERWFDHREVARLYNKVKASRDVEDQLLARFQNESNAIRLSMQAQRNMNIPDINLSIQEGQAPTETQWRQIAKIQKETPGARIYYDLLDDNLKVVKSGETNRLADVRRAVEKNETKPDILLRMAEVDPIIKEKFDVPEAHPVLSAMKGAFQRDNVTRAAAGRYADTIRTEVIDKYHPIKALGEIPYQLHRMLGNAHAVVATFLEHGKLKWKDQALMVTEKNKGFLPWLRKQGPDGRNLLYWMAAKRAEKLESEGRENWLTPDARDQIYEAVFKGLSPSQRTAKERDFERLNQEFQVWNRNIIDIALESGLLNQEQIDAWTRDYYLPFYRLLEDEVTREEFLKAPHKSKKHINAQIRRL
ncbi:MAG: hypothetical protein PHN75_17735, partial [Syntrophales bacterium]|nr:hypothetical protein [Syntrophales bacterium]